jgi:hypothetical protein
MATLLAWYWSGSPSAVPENRVASETAVTSTGM